MDYYVVSLYSDTQELPMVKWSVERFGCAESHPTFPFVEYVLRQRKARVYEARFQISSKYTSTITPSWKVIDGVENGLEAKRSCAKTSAKTAAESISALSDTLPVTGSYILYIVWDIRHLNPTDEQCLPLVGVAKKLCSWHGGKLIIYSENEPDPKTNLMLYFMDDCAETFSGENVFELSNQIFWHGRLELVAEKESPCVLSGFSLSLFGDSTKLLQCRVSLYQSNSICEQLTEFDHIWFATEITFLSFVNVSEIPNFYYTGKKFVLQHHCSKNCLDNEEKNSKTRTKINLLRSNAFLCSINYCFKNKTSETSSRNSFEKWRNMILKHPGTISDATYKLPKDVKMLPLLVKQSENDRHTTETSGGKITQFTAHILFSPHELAVQYPTLHDDLSTLTLSRIERFADLDALKHLNPHSLLHECGAFGSCVRKSVVQWITESEVSLVPMPKFEHVINEALETLTSSKDFSILFECADLSRHCISPIPHFRSLRATHKRFKHAISKITIPESLNIPTTNNGLSPPMPRVPDMHLMPQDILQCLSVSGQPRNVLPVLPQDTSIIPNLEILQDFDQALKMTYHGIMYNIEGRESERTDRKYQRLAEKHVKFETCSIASEGKVPSPATINITDSPIKKCMNVHTSRKTVVPKEITKNIHKRKINVWKRPGSSRTTKMMPGSPPKKFKSCMKSAQEFLTAATLTELRHKRKTHVQDNKKRLQEIIYQTLVEYNVQEGSKEFVNYSRTLYDVSMAFLKTLKSSKDLDRIMKETVAKNVRLVMPIS